MLVRCLEARYKFIHAWVVLHAAGAEWVHAVIDGVIPRGKREGRMTSISLTSGTRDAFAV